MPLTPIPSTIPTSSFYQLALQALYDIAGSGGGGGGGSVSVSNFPSLQNVIDHNSGANGGKIVAATTASGSGTWYALQFVTSGTLTAYAGNITGTVTGVTFPAGFVLYGNTTSFTTGSGTSVVAYTF
jgi:hypothetical protein